MAFGLDAITAPAEAHAPSSPAPSPWDDDEAPEPSRPRLMIARAPSPEPELDDPAEELGDLLPPPSGPVPKPITEIAETSFVRDTTGLAPLDHVLGGGLVEASVVLLASPPGIGKSSLTLQMLCGLGHRCLYATGEETEAQLAGTGRRIDALTPRLFVIAESDLMKILAHAHAMRAQTIAIDSIQKMVCEDVNGRAGSPTQLKECTARLVTFAKKKNTTIWIIGHVTGDGDIAGPKTIEHDVDVVLELSQGTKFEGNERILRCSGKNRFGPTNVKGHFELTAKGFRPLDGDGWDEPL
jgi:DNA repair protein RadA/Sms